MVAWRFSAAVAARVIPAVVTCVLAVSANAQPLRAQSESDPGPPTVDVLADPVWAVALAPATLRSQPDDAGEAFATLRPGAPLQIQGYAGGWAYVYNPRTKGTAYLPSDQLGPADPPSSYAEAEPPPTAEDIDRTGWVGDDTPLAMYPTPDPAAAYTELAAGTSVHLTATVRGDDDEDWYRTADGDYLPASAVSFPSPPAAPTFAAPVRGPTRTFAGHWIDVNLNLPARMTAYQGSTPVRSMFVIIGRGPLATPAGTFSIIRRVANETMDSSTVGIPRNGPGGYYLTGVLFTQYFLPGGQSIHYNYWSSNWGYPGSHGCLGLSYGDAAFMWSFAGIGTPVSIHY
jgi:hypothetical protein